MNRQNKTERLTRNAKRPKVVQKTNVKAMDILCAAGQVASCLLWVLVILSDTTVRRSTVKLENLKPYWKSEKRRHFSRRSKIILFTISNIS